MTNAIDNARKALENARWQFLDPDYRMTLGHERLMDALRDLLDSLEYEYGVEHVQVDGWVERELHLSLEDAQEDYRTCGMNCSLMRRIKAGKWEKVS